MTDVNNCGTIISGFQPDDGSTRVAVTVSSDASPQPHDLGPITLSNTTFEVRVGASLFQAGVEAGLIGDGFTMPTTISATLMGSNTTEGTRTFTQSMTTTLRVVDGVASTVVVTLQLPDTVWHPENRSLDVRFSEESARIVLDLDVEGIGIVRFTARCTPSAARPFVALGGVPETTTSTSTTILVVDPPLIGQTTTVPAANALPRTGSSSGYAVFFGLNCIAAGALVLGRSRRHWLR